ncbi:hypothetical protein PanWU01x14_153230, partial [Parasponia andersonii]
RRSNREHTRPTGYGDDGLDPAGDRGRGRRRRRGGGRGGGEDRSGRGRARAGGGDDGGLSLAEEPLDGLAVGSVAELPGQLEDTGRAHGRHPNPAASPVHLGVAVPRSGSGGGFSRNGDLGFGSRGGRYDGGGVGVEVVAGGGGGVVECNLRAHGEEN